MQTHDRRRTVNPRQIGLSMLLASTTAMQPPAHALERPQPGLWETTSQALLNGQDLYARMRQELQRQIAQLRSQRGDAAQIDALQNALAALSGVQRECISAEDSAAFADPKRALAEMQKDNPSCRYTLDSASGNSIDFHADCQPSADDTLSLRGRFNGRFELTSPRSWTFHYGGVGHIDITQEMASYLPGVKPGTQQMRIEARATGRWVAAQCPAGKP